MDRIKLFRLITILAGFLAIILTVVSVLRLGLFDSITNIFTVVLGALLTAALSVSVELFKSNPTTLTISLLGFPCAGKTVYLTTLFDVLQQYKMNKIRFAPYGSETVEEVAKNLNSLSKGIWLPRTSTADVFYYRANASIVRAFTNSSFKIEVGDFAGENMDELNPSSERWLHKTNYFKYVVQSDAIMLAIDSEILIKGSREEVDEMQNSFVAAVQILAESKGATESKKLKAPLALLFLKIDLLLSKPDIHLLDGQKKLDKLPERVSRLISVCEARCKNFKYFYVSSVGYTIDGGPPDVLRPFGVVDPLVWILEKVNKSS